MFIVQFEIKTGACGVLIHGVIGRKLINLIILIFRGARQDESAWSVEHIEDRLNLGNRLALCGCARSGFNKVNAIAKPVSFVASEEEDFVLHDRAAHRTSELIHPQWKLGIASRPHAIEKVPRIQLVVPEKFERRTVEGIAAGLRNNANLASATCAEFGTIGIGF